MSFVKSSRRPSLKSSRALRATDALVIAASLLTANLIWFGPATENIRLEGTDASYWTAATVIGVLWWIFLELWGSREERILGHGNDEYKRVFSACAWVFGFIAIVSYLFQIETSRGYVAFALPTGLASLLFSRFLWRKWLINRRKNGHLNHRVMLLGGPASVLHLHRSLSRFPGAGYQPIVAYLPGYSKTAPNGEELPLPVIGTSRDVDDIIHALEEHHLDAVAISSGAALSPRAIRKLGWELADRRIRLIMAPALTDVAGPRIHTQPIAGLPLIHVSTPRLSGINSLLKRSLDIVVSLLAITVLSPVLIATAIGVRVDSKGPIFFNHERIGKNGKTFKMHKFRSMVTDAEERMKDLKPDNSAGNEVQFKLKDDPRITRFGRFIRKYSIDELPQLYNVLKGEMSLVGPRPHVSREVGMYDDQASRRLLVQPGITGLWQVHGRSNLSWDDSVRLDLYYVENWSLSQDILILAKTFRAVFSPEGAY